MKNIIFSIVCLLPLWLTAQQDSVSTGVYQWQTPVNEAQPDIRSAMIFQGSTRDLQWLQMSAFALNPSINKKELRVPRNEEHLYIIKSGLLTVELNDSLYTLVPGSIVLLLPGEKFAVQNKSKSACDYYLMKYRAKEARSRNDSGHSFIIDWNKIAFAPHDKGGIRNYFQTSTVMTRRMEMHVSTLNTGLKSHDPHRDRAAEIVLMIEGETEMQIDQKFYDGVNGSVII